MDARYSPAGRALPNRLADELTGFLDGQVELLSEMSADLGSLADAARAAVLDGGKRLRPTFAYWGWRTAQPEGADGEDDLVRAAASLELLQACALVHDDVMDGSDTRRGRPAAHVRFAAEHARAGWPGSPTGFGTAAAILLGDLLLSWAGQLFTTGIQSLPAARAAGAERQFDLMRTEVVAGQFLDVLAQTRGQFDPDEALRVIRYKTSKYTIVRPLLLGAAAAGASAGMQAELARYGDLLGEAFQLRDDLLGVFGDPAETGKPAGDDLREGKRTLLVALAMSGGDTGVRRLLQECVGNPELSEAEVEELRSALGPAARQVEHRITARAADAVGCLSDAVGPEAQRALVELADAAAHRRF
ncbi:MAG TPA: polyprenyl synthetase family protein [Jatrophihabitans sp.]|nr:polyprenyl synthetase family protein [Jatrophihabitans sp.]